MNVTIIGTGYVGLVTGACLADAGNSVFCLDVDKNKIARLNEGQIPIFEPGLQPLVKRNREAGRLRFSTDVAASVTHGELQLIAVGTPPGEVSSVYALACSLLRHLYKPLHRNNDRVIVIDVLSAELTKYAANSMIATRITFMNEVANLAEAIGADIEEVRRGISSDPRIGYQFLYAGAGFGGSCFPKDVKALKRTAEEAGKPLRLVAAVEDVNEAQKHVLADKIRA